VGAEPEFESLQHLEAAIRATSPFGPLTDAQWHHLAVHVAKHENGRWRFRYDPGVGMSFHGTPPSDIDLRPYWQLIHGPVLVIRGEESDLLLPETLAEMQRRPHTTTHLVPKTGHCPMLMDDAQVGAVRHFLLTDA
jgi:pimeloyl-ACP methyl ester carboxylesterase